MIHTVLLGTFYVLSALFILLFYPLEMNWSYSLAELILLPLGMAICSWFVLIFKLYSPDSKWWIRFMRIAVLALGVHVYFLFMPFFHHGLQYGYNQSILSSALIMSVWVFVWGIIFKIPEWYSSALHGGKRTSSRGSNTPLCIPVVGTGNHSGTSGSDGGVGGCDAG